VKLTVAADVDDAVSHLLAVGARANNPERAFRAIADDLMADERRRFATRGFGRWQPDAPSTIKRKGNNKVLEQSGRLRRALTERSAPGQRLDISRTEMTFGLTPGGAAYYGRFHQQGKGVPKRQLVPDRPSPALRTKITGRVRSFIVTGTP
jgi:phage gpG-like protein